MTEIGASTAQYTVALPGARRGALLLSWGAATDIGRRRNHNEDSFLAASPIFVVADGMGGHASGEVASTAVVERLAKAMSGDFTEQDAIEESLRLATGDIGLAKDEHHLGVGTTVTGAALTLKRGKPYWTIFNVGDSRVYMFEHNELAQVTIDHSVVQELVDSGAITEEEAESHPDSNIITRAVGFNSEPMPDYWLLPVRAGLRLLLCSDGLTKEVGRERIRLHLAAGLSANETALALVDAALAAGGRDNVTVVVVDVVDVAEDAADAETASNLPQKGGG
ncbi:MAG: protein phosphatase 2C domain-containing protein [Lacisediminihabitans sp.]